jgi:uncharacterized Fe-S radical SAM superfamily protein PflX
LISIVVISTFSVNVRSSLNNRENLFSFSWNEFKEFLKKKKAGGGGRRRRKDIYKKKKKKTSNSFAACAICWRNCGVTASKLAMELHQIKLAKMKNKLKKRKEKKNHRFP